MLRNTLLALAATAGLIGGTELGGNTANAQTSIRVGVAGNNGSFAFGIGSGYGGYGYGPGVYRPVRPIRAYYPPIVIAPAPPVVIAPAPLVYSVYYRGCPAEPWVLYGSFASHFRAHEACDYLRHRGLEVYEAAR